MAKESGVSFSFDKRINLANMLAFVLIIVAALAAHFRMEAQVMQNTQSIGFNTGRIVAGDEEQEKDRTEILLVLKSINDNLQGKADKPGR